MKPERTKEEILKELLREAWSLGEQNADNTHGGFNLWYDRNKSRIESQSSPVESKLKQDFLEGDKLLGLAAHFVTPEPDGSANKTHFTDLVAVLMYYNDYLQGKIEETKEK